MYLYIDRKGNQDAILISGNLFINHKTSQTLMVSCIGYNQYLLMDIKDGQIIKSNNNNNTNSIIFTEKQVRDRYLTNDEWDYVQNKNVTMKLEIRNDN